MRHTKVALEHALIQLQSETDPVVAKLERFDMSLAEDESLAANRSFLRRGG